MLKNLLRIFFISAFLLTSSCGDSTEVEYATKKSLIVATSADFAPFEFIKDKKIHREAAISSYLVTSLSR